MSEPINPRVIDLSHWDPAYDYGAVKDEGIVGVIYKATQGQSYQDDTYVDQQHAAKGVGLLWGSYHFADGTDAEGQAENYLTFACPDPDELFCLDWEDNPGGTKMSAEQARQWITIVETALGRPGECVIYGGNTLKENLGSSDEFFGQRRLWLCQYGSTPVLPDCWDKYWLWQYTDGIYGPSPHSIDGVGPCDINSYDGEVEDLIASWCPNAPPPIPPVRESVVGMKLTVPDGVTVSIEINGEYVDASSLKGSASRYVRGKRRQLNTGYSKERWERIRQGRYRKEAT